MPKLQQRKDGGYYTRDYVFGVGNRTLQVSEEGVKLLARYGIKKGDEFPKNILMELVRRDLVHTAKSGIKIIETTTDEEQNPPSPSSRFNEVLTLALRNKGPEWTLSIFIPELPADWVKNMSSINTFLTDCLLGVDESLTIQTTQIWPGKGGFYLPVRIREEPYVIRLLGPWPEIAELNAWLLPIDGAKHSGMLFEDQEAGGLLLGAGEAVIPGESYVLLAQVDAYSVLHLPRRLSQQLLGRRDGWEAWELNLPLVIDEEMREWFVHLGHPIERSLWQMTLVSPIPQDYTVDWTPIVETGQEVVISLQPPLTSSEEDEYIELSIRCDNNDFATLPINTKLSADEPHIRPETTKDIKTDKTPSSLQYIVLPLNSAGTYEIFSPAGLMKPFKLYVTHSPSLQPATFNQIPSLEALVLAGSSQKHFEAFANDSKACVVTTTGDAQNVGLEVEVRCLIPVNLVWSYGKFRRQRQRVPVSDVMECLRTDLHESLIAKRLFILHIDAGAFGELHIQIVPEIEARSRIGPCEYQIESLPATTFRRALWLAQVLHALPPSINDPYAPLTRRVRTALGKFESIPECSPLARLKAAPQFLIPHLMSLAKTVESSMHGGMPSGDREALDD